MKWILAFTLVACGHSADAAPLTVKSAAFAANAEIPTAHTCEGADVEPPLTWGTPPPGTKAIAIIVDDPDAPDPAKPQRTWVHLVRVIVGARKIDGNNDWGTPGWRGPCPPIGRHRYFFKVYALDTELGTPGITKAALLDAMRGHVLAQGELVGTYQKKK